MKKNIMRLTSLLMACTVIFSANTFVYATETTEVEESTDSDEVVISEDDKPYLSLGADLSAEQQHTVLSLMGINAEDLDEYNVQYVTNDEEHEYLDAYIPSENIGSRSLSSVVIVEAEEGDGISISTYNINYCTVGMYKNACATAGITDADIIVAGPFSISGTAALLGIFKAYEEMTGEDLNDDVVDAAMDELVTTGELNESIDGDSEDVEALIADLKQQLADGNLDSDEDILAAIDETATKYDLTLSEADKEKILELLNKLKGLDLDWDSIANQASAWADKLGDIDIDTDGLLDKIGNFFQKLIDAIKSLFS